MARRPLSGRGERTDRLPTISPLAIDLRAPLSPRALKRARATEELRSDSQVGPARARSTARACAEEQIKTWTEDARIKGGPGP